MIEYCVRLHARMLLHALYLVVYAVCVCVWELNFHNSECILEYIVRHSLPATQQPATAYHSGR